MRRWYLTTSISKARDIAALGALDQQGIGVRLSVIVRDSRGRRVGGGRAARI